MRSAFIIDVIIIKQSNQIESIMNGESVQMKEIPLRVIFVLRKNWLCVVSISTWRNTCWMHSDCLCRRAVQLSEIRNRLHRNSSAGQCLQLESLEKLLLDMDSSKLSVPLPPSCIAKIWIEKINTCSLKVSKIASQRDVVPVDRLLWWTPWIAMGK